MVNTAQFRFNVADRSYLAVLKKEIHQLAAVGSFSPKRLAELDIVVSEIGSNLIKHATGGELIVRLLDKPNPGLELIALDAGPGMADPERMVQDGISTTGTLGQGLGAIKRLSDQFQLYSLRDWGTVLLVRLFTQPTPAITPLLNTSVGVVVLPLPGQTACGDGYALEETPNYVKLFLGDGLGHGPLAQTAVQTAIAAFRQCPEVSPVAIVRRLHKAVSGTRGLVGTVVVADRLRQKWVLCGIGNIASSVGDATKLTGYAPHNGIIGSNIPNALIDYELNFEAGQQVILCSDGIAARWDTRRYPAIFKYDSAILAAALYKDNVRRTDDASVLVGRVY